MNWLTIVASILFCFLSVGAAPSTGFAADQPEALRFSCSAQIAEAIGPKGFEAFEKQTGIQLATYVCSSQAAIHRLIYGHSDVAATMEELQYDQQAYGYVETPICNDPLAVIVNTKLPVENLTVLQLQMIFSGQITNWKEFGGPDQSIMVVIPAKETAAFKNFDRRAMRYREPKYDLMAYKSTGIIQVVAQIPNAVSFISQGAASGKENIKTLRVGNRALSDPEYPFHQTFFIVTKGEPTGNIKRFIEFWKSGNGLELLTQKGMTSTR